MRRVLRQILAAGALAGGVMCAPATRLLSVEVPFDFTALDLHFQAGRYLVDLRTPGRVILRTPEGRAVALLAQGAASGAPVEQAQLVFRCYGQECFLAQAWSSGGEIGRQFRPGSREREMARSLTPPGREILLAKAASR